MVNKTGYLQKLDGILDMMKKCQLEDAVSNEIEKLRGAIDEYAFRILMIGGFSAGKSAFLNTLLSRETLLKEDQAPETTIATELVYDEAEFIEAVNAKGEKARFLLKEGDSLSPKDWRYLIYHVNSPFLKTHPNVTLVDMPGLDSNISNHNMAIAQYISKGSAYILLVSCEDGTLKESTRDFLWEVTQYPQSITCFVSKSDLKVDRETAEVVETIRSEIAVAYGRSVPVCNISVFDEDFVKKAQDVIEAFDAQALFEEKYRNAINAVISTGQAALSTSADAMSLDLQTINQNISACTKNRDNLKRKLVQEKAELERKYDRQVIPAVLEDVENALLGQTGRLTQALTVSGEAFNACVNSILRPILVNSTQQHIVSSFNEYIEHLDLTNLMGEDNEAVRQSIADGLELVRSYALTVQENVRKAELRKGRGRSYELITGAIAIATDFVAPIIELAIVFLPLIFEVVAGINQKAQYEDLEQKVRYVVIPEIVSKLQPQITAAIQEMRDAMLEALQANLEETLSAQEMALQQALEKRQQATDDFNAMQDEYRQAIKLLEGLRA